VHSDDEQGKPPGFRRQPREQAERGTVGPLQVIEHQQQPRAGPALLRERVDNTRVRGEGGGNAVLGGAVLAMGGTRGHGGQGGARCRKTTDRPDPGPQGRHPGVVNRATPADLDAVCRGG